MTDLTLSGLDDGRGGARPALADVNPFSLVEAVNDTSEIAHTGWVIFLGVVAYFCIATAGVSHKDLLLNSAVQLPFMQVSIDLTRFFLFAPVVLLFMHFGLLVQHVMLARKVMEFDAAVRAMEPGLKRTHPIRHELHSYFFTQALAGPERSKLFGGFLHGMFWLSIIGTPVLVILFIQIVFLPYHDVTTTWTHRLALVADTALLGLMGVFLGSRSTSFFKAFGRMISNQPWNFLLTAGLYALIIFFSFFVATIPDEPLDRFTQSLPGARVHATASADGELRQRRVFAVTDWFFETASTGEGERGLLRRNIGVTDEDVTDRDGKTATSQAPVSLRGRDLRFAELSRSDFSGVDFTGADLTGARLIGANLKGARLSCLDVDAVLSEPRLRAENCARVTSADFTRATLSGADLRLVIADGANFENATIRGTDLRYANLVGANLSGADLRGASMGGGVDLTGANFLGANLAGADLKGAKIQACEFYGAEMQATRLVFAQAQGANFQGAKLQGAHLAAAKLLGADLTDADLTAADFGNATVWQTKPPGSGQTSLTDVSTLVMKAPDAKDLKALKDLKATLRAPKVAAKIQKLIDRVSSSEDSASWNAGDEATAWAGLKQANLTSDAGQRIEKTGEYLARISCEAAQSDGAVAGGVIRRTVDQPAKSAPVTLMKKLKGPECPAAKQLTEVQVLSLAAVIEKSAPARDVAAVAPAPAPAPEAPAQSTSAEAGPGGEPVPPPNQ